jgi:hypothetical protein
MKERPHRGARGRKAGALAVAGLLSLPLSAILASPAGAGSDARPNLWDPDTFMAQDGVEYSYFSSMPLGRGLCGQDSWGEKNWVPAIRHRVSTGLANDCVTRDVMPTGPGNWAYQDEDIWAPSISFFAGRYFLHYSAAKLGTRQFVNGKKLVQYCIGVASSSSPLGPFGNQQEFACPAGGRWAIDPDVTVEGNEAVLTYRDDAVTTGRNTGLSSVRLGSNGHANWATRRTVMLSTDVGWDRITAGPNQGMDLIENPSLIKMSDGYYYLFFSGNEWQSSKYATGIANCGTTLLPASRCKLISDANRPYFGHSSTNPVRQLPGNRPGAGAMSPYKSTTHRASWHYYTGGADYTGAPTRKSTSGYTLSLTNGFFNIT